ncbi:Annexin (Annexin) Family [Phytophthora cinnamomi]|uniref:Annexin (Annexin) Family n=1 Tax=Phytophthora cinnamomi TaxID=4785 RepID=UPI00355A71E7|nr:Annexin (Annexin) Family [Phytophthora cinnamomi]
MRQALLSPYISSARVVKQMAPSCTLVSEKQLNAFVNQFRLLTQIDTYFGVNPGLDKAVKVAKSHSNGSISDEVLEQVSKQVLSNRAVERYRGERWLAELLTYGQDDDVFTSYDSKATTTTGSVRKQPEAVLVRPKPGSVAQSTPAGEELEETFCYDEGGEIGLAAQAKFWELASPTTAPALRESFARVLELFVRRKLQLSSGKAEETTIEEINTCLRVLLDHEESEPGVLIPVMLLILDICQCELSYIDKRWQQRDSSMSSVAIDNQLEETYNRLAWSDSLAARVLNGEVALDKVLLRQMDTAFFLHVLKVLHEHSDNHKSIECRRVCCGVEKTLVGDVAACTALILMDILADNDAALAHAGGLAALTPFLQACDTRIAVFMAKLISQLVKQADEVQYAAFLRELYVACVEADDESALYNSYLHTQTLLHDLNVT